MKKVFITGSSGVIGEAIAKEYSKNGYFLYLHYHKGDKKAKKLLNELKNGELISFSLTNHQEIREKLKDIEVDVLVNSAGVIKDNLFFFMSDEEWSEVIDINLNGVFFVTKELLPKMIKNKNGSIINVTSISGLVGNIGQTNYSASKGAIIAFTKSLSLEVARYNIRVNAIAPGIIESSMTKELKKEELLKLIPSKRFGKPSEVAEVAYFLGNQGTYINGEVINISGGMVR